MTKERQIKRAKEVFAVEIEGLKKTRDSIGKSFTDAVKLMLDATSRDGIVVVTGVGKNLHVAEKMSAIFSSTGTRSIVLNPVQAMHGDLGMTSSRAKSIRTFSHRVLKDKSSAFWMSALLYGGTYGIRFFTRSNFRSC